eukprot:1849233-Amphidinium_carterae.1
MRVFAEDVHSSNVFSIGDSRDLGSINAQLPKLAHHGNCEGCGEQRYRSCEVLMALLVAQPTWPAELSLQR